MSGLDNSQPLTDDAVLTHKDSTQSPPAAPTTKPLDQEATAQPQRPQRQ